MKTYLDSALPQRLRRAVPLAVVIESEVGKRVVAAGAAVVVLRLLPAARALVQLAFGLTADAKYPSVNYDFD